MSMRFLAGLLLAVAFVLPAQAEFSSAQKTEIEGIVKQYIADHPEMIGTAIEALQAKMAAEEAQQKAAAVKGNQAALKSIDSTKAAAGNPMGDVTIVEFFDYNCGYCHAAASVVKQMISEDSKVRVVYREFPILGPDSLLASKVALAAAQQGKYLAVHNALMSAGERLNEGVIMDIAKKAGLDMPKLQADMESDAVRDEQRANFELAEKLGLRGTPAFIIGEQLFPGIIDLQQMKKAVAAARH